MIARLVKTVGPYSITQDARGYTLLDTNAREVAAGPCLDAMENAAALLSNVIPEAR